MIIILNRFYDSLNEYLNADSVYFGSLLFFGNTFSRNILIE